MVSNEHDTDIWIPTPAELADAEQREASPVRRPGRAGSAPTRRRMSVSTRITRGTESGERADG